jgi:hypothetical protein
VANACNKSQPGQIKWADRVAQGVGPEIKPQYRQKKKNPSFKSTLSKFRITRFLKYRKLVSFLDNKTFQVGS